MNGQQLNGVSNDASYHLLVKIIKYKSEDKK